MNTTTAQPYPVRFAVDYPDRPLNRMTTAFRDLRRDPHLHRAGRGLGWDLAVVETAGSTAVAGAGGLLFLGPLLMILFRQKYPRWWFDWNLELQRFTNRVGVYLALWTIATRPPPTISRCTSTTTIPTPPAI